MSRCSQAEDLFQARTEFFAAHKEYEAARSSFKRAVDGDDQGEISRASHAVSKTLERLAAAQDRIRGAKERPPVPAQAAEHNRADSRNCRMCMTLEDREYDARCVYEMAVWTLAHEAATAEVTAYEQLKSAVFEAYDSLSNVRATLREHTAIHRKEVVDMQSVQAGRASGG